MRPLTVFGWLCFLTFAPGADPVAGQVPGRARLTMPALDCRDCHTGATPTRADPALLACPRLQVSGFHLLSDAPTTMTLGSATGRFVLTFADGRAFTVVFRHADTPIEAEPVLGIPAQDVGAFYRLTLRFLEIL